MRNVSLVARTGARLLIRFMCYFAALFLIISADWIGRTFGSPTIPQIIYHLRFADTLVTADAAFLNGFVSDCAKLAFGAGIFVFAVDRLAATLLRRRTGSAQPPVTGTRLTRLTYRVQRVAPTLMLAVSLAIVGSQFSVLTYASVILTGEDPFSEYYRDPQAVAVTANTPKNLILIYVESLEASYSDANLFGEDLLEPLNDLPGTSFALHRPSLGVEWTMAGLVGTQCGIPLQIVTRIDGRDHSRGIAANDTGARVASFLPNAVCLPDILHSAGYRNVFLGGAHLSFAGKGTYLKTHHYDELFGLTEWKAMELDPSKFSAWGLYDDELFAFAKQKVAELDAAGGLYNLTLLTVDMHHPDGHYSRLCRSKGAETFSGVVRCTAELVADFVEFLSDGGYLRNTNVVILGDHLAMPNSVQGMLERHRHRTIFNKFISSSPPPKNAEDLQSFDMFPTILEFLGFEITGKRLGLGRSAFFEFDSEQSSLPIPEVPLETLSYSETYRRLWTGEGESKTL